MWNIAQEYEGQLQVWLLAKKKINVIKFYDDYHHTQYWIRGIPPDTIASRVMPWKGFMVH